MKAPERKCKINTLKVMEATIKAPIHAEGTLDAVYALGEGVEGEQNMRLVATHGRCTANTNNWSKDTRELLNELLLAMEEDLLPRHFEKTAGTEGTNEGIKSGTGEEDRQI